MFKIKNNKKIKIFVSVILSFIIVFSFSIIYAKYVLQNEFNIANINIDGTKPKIELVNITNTNSEYPNYASKKHNIIVRIKISDKNIKDIFLDKEHVKVKIAEKIVEEPNIKFTKIQDLVNCKIYDIELKDLQENGNLKLNISNNTVIDQGELSNDFLEIDTNIVIDNIAPTGNFKENKISDGKVCASIELSEFIRNLDGWNFSKDKLSVSKEFTNNVSYELPILDFAGNEGKVEISITKASYINIVYASHNSVVGWSFGYGNYDVAGKDAIMRNSVYKTEALAFNISGNIDEDFVQGNSYIYTYWGDGSFGKCTTSGIIYNFGYNPLDGRYKSMKSSDLVTIDNKKYFQFGGSGINGYQNPDLYGNNPIPGYVANKYEYGICGMKFRLKDYSQFSIVYQILIDRVGWIASCSNGQECMYAKDRPMSAFRIALIPNSERQYVIDTWNKDVGTFNIK